LPANEVSRNENEGKIQISTSSRWWNRDAKYYFLTDPARLYMALPRGTALEISLDSGKANYGPVSPYRETTFADAHAFAQIYVSRTSLRFSSITDVLTAKETGR